MKRWLAMLLVLGLLGLAVPAPAADKGDAAEAKEALKALQEFIGEWNGLGGPDKPRPDPKDKIWKEKINWGWRFKGDDAWLTFSVKDGQHLKGGEVRYLPEKQKYQVTTINTEGKKADFVGEFKNETLTVQRVDPATKDTQQISLSTNNDGARMILRYGRKPSGSTLYRREYRVEATKEGETLGTKEKKNVCVVSGGVGTIQVSFKGETFYVCCSGCADAFRENPEKYIKEFKAKNAKK
jgi:hypothetical protein